MKQSAIVIGVIFLMSGTAKASIGETVINAVVAVPEPMTVVLLGFGLAGLVVARKWRK
jgi:hypothetical protein